MKIMNNINKYIDFYESKLKEAAFYANKKEMGFVRSTMKESVEGLLDLIWTTETNGISKKNDFIDCHSKSGCKLKFQVDRHLYLNNGLVSIGECKAYLDRCFMERASSDFGRIIRGLETRPVSFILALEDAVGKDAYTFYMDEGTIDRVFYLCDGKRSPLKPIWKQKFYKPINKNKLEDFIKFIHTGLIINDTK